MSDRADTQELLERWHGGDRNALDALIDRHLEWIEGRVRQRLGGLLRARAETQDYVQDAVLEVLEYGPRFVTANRAQFRGLVARIVENVLRDRHDHAVAKKRDPRRESPLPSQSVVHLDAGYDPVTRPSEDAMRAERQAWIRLALELLEPDDRRVIILRQIEGRTFREVGDALGIPENSARMRFQRAIPKLAARAESLAQGQLDDF